MNKMYSFPSISRSGRAPDNVLGFYQRLAVQASRTEHLETLLEFLLTEIVGLFGADSASVMVYEPIEGVLRLFLSAAHPSAVKNRRVSAEEGVAGFVFKSGRPLLISDLAMVPPGLKLRRGKAGESFLCVPLRIARRKIGVMNLNRTQGKEPFSAGDLRLLESLQGQVAAVIDKQRLGDELSRRTGELETLYRLMSGLHAGDLPFAKLLKQFLEGLSRHLDLDRAAVIAMGEGPNGDEEPEILASLRLRKADLERILEEVRRRLAKAVDSAIAPGPAKDSEPQKGADAGEIELSRDLNRAGFLYLEDGKPFDLFFLPLAGKESTSHFLLVSRPSMLPDSDAVELHYRFLQVVSRELAVAIDRERMMQRIAADQQILLDSAFQNGIYLEISKELGSTLDPLIVLRKAFEQFARLIPFDSITVLQFEDLDEAYQIIVQPVVPMTDSYLVDLKKHLYRTFAEYPTDPPLTNKSQMQYEVYSPQNPGASAVRKCRHQLSLPIILDEKVRGMIHLGKEAGEPFSKKDWETTTQFTGIFLTSIKNARIHRKTEKLAFTDPLTGLYNHRAFQENLLQEFTRAKRYGKPLSLMILDIDHFKKFNDTWGHLVGDRVLKHVARLFEGAVREKIDLVARYGGEEFAVLLPETNLPGAEVFGERIRSTVESTPLELDGKKLPITISIGVACTTVTHCDKTSELVGSADFALYRAKDSGRNRVWLYDQENVPRGKA